MKKIIAAVLAATLIASVTGCGKTEKTVSDRRVKVTLWTNVTQDSEQSAKDLQEILENNIVDKFPQYDVQFIPKVYTDYNQDYDKALMAGNAPDAFDMFSYTAIPTRIKNGTVADISDLVEEWKMKKEDKVINTFDSIIQKDNKWYAVPREAYTMALYVNKKAIKDGGENPDVLPKTWDEFDSYCQKITDKNAPRFGYEIMGMDYCAWAFTPWVWSAGGEMVEPTADGKWRIAFTDDAGVDAACYLHKLVSESKVTQTNILCSLSDTDNDMMSGKACFAWGTVANVDAKKAEQFGLSMNDFTQTCIPSMNSSIVNPALAGGEVITLNPKCDKETMKAAFEVMTYMHYDEAYLKQKWQFVFNNGSCDIHIPARKDLFETKLNMNTLLTDEAKANLMLQAEVSKPEPYCEHWGDVKSQLVIPLQKIYSLPNLDRNAIKVILDGCADELCRLYPETFVR